MAVIHTESFAWSDTNSDYVTKGYTATGFAPSSASPPWPGAHYVPCPFFPWTWSPPAGYGRLITGFRAKEAGNFTSFVWISNAAGFTQLSLTSDGTGHMQVRAGGAVSTVIATGTHVAWGDNLWHYIEVDWNFGGTLVVYIDGVPDISVANSATGTIGAINWQVNGGSGQLLITDLYVSDPAVGPNTGFLGDRHIEYRAVNAAGSSSGWTPHGTATNYTAVADTPHPDHDTTFVSTAVVGNRDYYGLPNINEAAPSSIAAVACYVIATKDDTPPRGVKASIQSSGTDLDGTEDVLSYSGAEIWGGARVIAQVDPNTGAAWTVSAANAAQVGQLLSS